MRDRRALVIVALFSWGVLDDPPPALLRGAPPILLGLTDTDAYEPGSSVDQRLVLAVQLLAGHGHTMQS